MTLKRMRNVLSPWLRQIELDKILYIEGLKDYVKIYVEDEPRPVLSLTASEVKVGDTITSVENPCREAIAGFEEVKPMVFAGVYPVLCVTGIRADIFSR